MYIFYIIVIATSIKEPNKKSYKSAADIVFKYAVMSVIILRGRPGKISPYTLLVISYIMTCSTFITTIKVHMLDEYKVE